MIHHRNCLKCGDPFTTDNRHIHLCEKCHNTVNQHDYTFLEEWVNRYQGYPILLKEDMEELEYLL